MTVKSRLTINIPTEEKLLLKVWAASQNRTINDLVNDKIRTFRLSR